MELETRVRMFEWRSSLCVCYSVWTAWDGVAEGGKGCGCGEMGLARIFGETGVCMCGGKNKCASV